MTVGKPFARLIEILIRVVWSAYLPAGSLIDISTHFGHNGLGVVINKDCVIAANCFIGTHVVMGGKAPYPGAPKLEKNVSIHAGAKLIGPITIGEGSVVGANAVVTKSLPAYSLAIGVPARIVKTDIDPSSYR
jgi:serine O-acetyltransferase